jgi:RnfABCDGE-type electron transport complex B subunit
MLIITAILVLGIVGFVFAGLLGLAADYFKIEEDLRLGAIVAILPGTNCGACGAAGCHNFAEKLIKGEVQVSGCVAGGQGVADQLAKLMGVEALTVHKQVATVHCGAAEEQRKKKARYSGVKTCAAADMIDSGGLACSYGCLGYSDCFCVCLFDAIKMVAGLPVIDAEKCTACGKCVTACPRQIIDLRPYDGHVVVACWSRDPGAYVRKICPVGCIGCRICEKLAPEVFKIVDNLALVDYDKKDIDCRAAIEKCPTKCILNMRH